MKDERFFSSTKEDCGFLVKKGENDTIVFSFIGGKESFKLILGLDAAEEMARHILGLSELDLFSPGSFAKEFEEHIRKTSKKKVDDLKFPN